MGATDLLPHAHEHPSAKRVAVDAGGLLRVFLALSLLELAAELLARELAEAGAGLVVGADRLLVGVLRVGGDLLGDRANLGDDPLVVLRVVQELVDPRLATRRTAGRSLSKSSWPSTRPTWM